MGLKEHPGNLCLNLALAHSSVEFIKALHPQLLNMVEVDLSTNSESASQIAEISINFRLN